MHEMGLMKDLVRRVVSVATDQHAARVVRVQLRIGALCHLSEAHLREHFDDAVRDTPAAGAVLEVVTDTDIADPHAQDVRLIAVDVQ